MKLVLAAAAALLAACGGSSKHTSGTAAAPTCAQSADHMKSLLPDPTSEKAGKLHDALAERCTKDAWAVDVRACIAGTKSLDDPQHCKDKLTPEQHTAFDADLEAIANPPDTEAHDDDMDACAEYREGMDRLMSCDKIPQATKDAMEQGFEAMQSGMADMGSSNPDARTAAIQACKAATDAVKQTVAAMGCDQ